MLAVVGYRCTECGREGEVPGELAGKRGRCPSCHTWLTVSKGHCRSSASGVRLPDEPVEGVDPELGAHLLALERVPLRLIDTLAGVIALATVCGSLGLALGSSVAQVAATVVLASAALLWFVIESRSGRETLLLAERGLRLPGGEALVWGDLLTFERGHIEAARWTIHSVHGSRRVPAGFCLTHGRHWIELLWPPRREQARETLHRRAARAIRLVEEAA